MKGISFRPGRSADAHQIARLHIASWQHAYRGILTDSYLDGAIEADRLGVWTKRLEEEPAASMYIQLAERQNGLVGFICAIRDTDPEFGTLIDNLHVHPSCQRLGLGRKLLLDTARWVVQQNPSDSLYLWVYEANLKARLFYERMGGEAVEQRSEKQPDGFEAEIIRYCWPHPDSLIRVT